MARTSAVLPLSLLSLKGENVGAETVILTCTRGQTRFCHLQRYLRAFNKVLWNVGLQLREDARNELGDLSVTTVPGICKIFPYCAKCETDVRAAVALLGYLFRVHRCIVSAEMNYAVANAGMLAKAMETLPSLKSLTIFGIASDQPQFLRHCLIKDYSTDCSGAFKFPHGYEHSLDTMPIPVRLLEQGDARLTSLDVAALEMSPFTRKKLIKALIQNHTITDVAVGACVFAAGPFDGPPFEEYLLKEKATLRKLSLKGLHFINETVWLRTLAQAISAMTTLRELDAQWLAPRQDCELFTIVVSHNRFLRYLTLDLSAIADSAGLQRHERVAATNDRSWIVAVQENSALEQLDLNVSWSTIENCCLLIRALESKRGLQSLTLRNIPGAHRLEEVCSTIRRSGLVDKVCIVDQHVKILNAPTLSYFPEVTGIRVYVAQFDNRVPMQCFFRGLMACEDISSLHVFLDSFDESVYASLNTYIKGASALKEIDLDIGVGIDDDVDDEALAQSISNLCKALCSNLRTTKVRLDWSGNLCDEDCQTLAEAVLSNRRLHELALLLARSEYTTVFLRHLLPRFHENYSLLRLEIPLCIERYANMFSAQDIVRRNCSLIERATSFVLEDHDPYCARAVELVSEHPELVENVRRKSALSDEAEAVAVIRKALRRPCLINLHEFMRLTGVVKKRVVCHFRGDGVTQFDQLNHDCWVHIRRYLIVADVVEA